MGLPLYHVILHVVVEVGGHVPTSTLVSTKQVLSIIAAADDA